MDLIIFFHGFNKLKKQLMNNFIKNLQFMSQIHIILENNVCIIKVISHR